MSENAHLTAIRRLVDTYGSRMLIVDHAKALARQLAEAEARAARWKAHAVAWERYNHAFMLLTEPEIDEAQLVLVATESQLRKHGDLAPTEMQP